MKDRIERLQQQLEVNRDINVLNTEALPTLTVDPCFMRMLQQARRGDLAPTELDELIENAVHGCIRAVLRINQYLVINSTQQKRLAGIYRRTWDLLCHADDIESILRHEHYPALNVWVAELYPPHLLEPLSRQPEIRAITCAEYSASLQCEVLAIHPEDLVEPILDIGCGTHASLVTYLQSRGKEVYGFDRLVEQPSDIVTQCDWFTYNFFQRPWGTVISHMAFSNHYRYAIHHDPELKQRMEGVFVRIPTVVSPTGVFDLCPGSDELDAWIDEGRYGLETLAILPVVP